MLISNISKVYETAKVRVVALQDVSLRFEEGVFAAVTGASGAGKSPLLNRLGGAGKGLAHAAPRGAPLPPPFRATGGQTAAGAHRPGAGHPASGPARGRAD